MKIFYNILIVALLLSAASCSRKVTAVIQHTTLHQDSSSTAIDTSKNSFSVEQETSNFYGDTITTKIIVPYTQKIDSVKSNLNIISTPFFIESNGIKIIGTLKPRDDGLGLDVDLKAISKPKETRTRTTTTGTEQKGIATHTEDKKDVKQYVKTKTTEAVNELPKYIAFTLWGFGLLGLIAIVIYLYIKNKRNGY